MSYLVVDRYGGEVYLTKVNSEMCALNDFHFSSSLHLFQMPFYLLCSKSYSELPRVGFKVK